MERIRGLEEYVKNKEYREEITTSCELWKPDASGASD